MKIIKPSFNVINEDNINKKIELVARTCYKSEDRITKDSCYQMVGNLIKRKHYAMLEHASMGFIVDENIYNAIVYATKVLQESLKENYSHCYLRFTKKFTKTGKRCVVSGNIRAWIEFSEALETYLDGDMPDYMNKIAFYSDNIIKYKNQDYEELSYGVSLITDYDTLTTEEQMVHRDLTIRFVVDRGVTHELVRHRPASFAQESTRYCNYSLGKFDNEITVIEPCFFEKFEDNSSIMTQEYNDWMSSCEFAEKRYFSLLKNKATPQQARSVLPNSLKSEIIVTANINEWIHIFNLRACDATGSAHPQMSEIMRPCLIEQQKEYPDLFGGLKIPE